MHNYLNTRVRVDENIPQTQVVCMPLYFYKNGLLALNDYRSLMRELVDILERE